MEEEVARRPEEGELRLLARDEEGAHHAQLERAHLVRVRARVRVRVRVTLGLGLGYAQALAPLEVEEQ